MAVCSCTGGLDMDILLVVVLAVKSLVDTEVLLNGERGVESERLITQGADIHFPVLFLVLWAFVRLDRAVVCTKNS